MQELIWEILTITFCFFYLKQAQKQITDPTTS